MSSPSNSDKNASKSPNDEKKSKEDSSKNTKSTKEPAFRNNAGSNVFSKGPTVKANPVDISRRTNAPQAPTGNFNKGKIIQI